MASFLVGFLHFFC